MERNPNRSSVRFNLSPRIAGEIGQAGRSDERLAQLFGARAERCSRIDGWIAAGAPAALQRPQGIERNTSYAVIGPIRRRVPGRRRLDRFMNPRIMRTASVWVAGRRLHPVQTGHEQRKLHPTEL
jgi:hypothetical protein